LRSWNFSNNGVPVSQSTEWAILSSEVDDTSTTWAGYIPPVGYGSLATSTTKLTVDYVRYYAPTNMLFWTGTASAYLTNAANYVSNMPPLSTSDLQFSSLSGNKLSPVAGQDLSVDGLAFLNMNNGFILGGSNTLTLGAGGIDMIAANHSVTLNCPINIGANQTWAIGPNNPGNTLNANSSISGSGTLTKATEGTIILNGTNRFSGTLNVDTSSTTSSDGIVRITRSENVTNVAAIAIRNNNGGSSTLQLDGSLGNVTVPPNITLNGRNTNVAAIENRSGSNTLGGGISINVGGGFYLLQSDAGTLNLGGIISSVATGTRTFTFQGSGNFYVSGSIQNGSATVNLVKTNSGTLTLAGTNRYTGSTTMNGGTLLVNGALAGGPVTATTGTLGGSGSIGGPVSIQSGSTLVPGGSLTTLAISNTLIATP
jgi:autotransporter-associated beta strand protein